MATDIQSSLRSMAVVGAGGKMGRGIALLLLELQAETFLLKDTIDEPFYLYLVDMSDHSLTALYHYLKVQLKKGGEKKLERLKQAYKHRPEIQEDKNLLIQNYLDDLLSHIRMSSSLEGCQKAHLIFEAAVENPDIKKEIFHRLKELCSPSTSFFTNTSSIPISEIEKTTGLTGRLMGVHFYNPPPVQKLVEIITTTTTSPEIFQLVHELGKRMNKILIPSHDVAGFIGNGHFIRDGLYALSLVDKLAPTYSLPAAIYMVNKISHEFLLRPMGIFQLIDYVGLDVFHSILKIMRHHHKEDSLVSLLIERCLALDIKGGQHGDGTQKDGFFEYQRGQIVAVYDPEAKIYHPLSLVSWRQSIDEYLGPRPQHQMNWSSLVKDPQREEKLKSYFQDLFITKTAGAQMAQNYLLKSKEIALHLFRSGVAQTEEDVNGVLMNGFYHLYGPINPYYT